MSIQMLAHWIALYVKNTEIINFESFGIELKKVPKEIRHFIGDKKIKTNIFRIISVVIGKVRTLFFLSV